MRLSIRWRLTLWNVLGLAGLLAGFAALVYGLLARAHYQRIDRALRTEFHELEEGPGPGAEGRTWLRHWIAEVREHEGFFCVVHDTSGEVYERTEELPAGSVPPPRAAPDAAPRLQDAEVPGIGRQRLLSGGMRLGGRPFTVVLLAPLAEVDRELGLLRTTLLLAVPAALAVAGGWGYVMARKALAPMERLRRSTEEITASRLDRRLPGADAPDELGRLTQTINAMIARLERSFAEMRRFTADASHELRTPLAAIRTEAEVALNRPLDSGEFQQLLGSILEECERLTRLTEQLLALAREDAGAAPQGQEPVDVPALVRGVVENMRPLAEARGVALQVQADGPAEVRGDGLRLRQVFYNVLDNALKYTPMGGTVTVRSGRRGRDAVVRVTDTGVGIPPEHLPRVFDRFYRVDRARSREQGGTGLGLSIARSIVAAHGGRIELDSAPGRGTTCTVTLPEKWDEEKNLEELL
jgi:heavy metal sensor kinase